MPDQENPVSWDLFYLTKEGMEAHLQLKAASVEDTLSQAGAALTKVQEASGVARPRRGGSAAVRVPSPKAGPCPG